MPAPELIFASAPIDRNLQIQSLTAALAEVEKLQQAKQVLLSPGWDLPHVLDHCARSIEYAMQGFPDLKSELFRSTVGSLAFHVFDLRGRMSHNLNEEIPGSSFEAQDHSLAAALERLRQSTALFLAYEGPLMPHFAYGALSKRQYERANAMHIANHLSAMEF